MCICWWMNCVKKSFIFRGQCASYISLILFQRYKLKNGYNFVIEIGDLFETQSKINWGVELRNRNSVTVSADMSAFFFIYLRFPLPPPPGHLPFSRHFVKRLFSLKRARRLNLWPINYITLESVAAERQITLQWRRVGPGLRREDRNNARICPHSAISGVRSPG